MCVDFLGPDSRLFQFPMAAVLTCLWGHMVYLLSVIESPSAAPYEPSIRTLVITLGPEYSRIICHSQCPQLYVCKAPFAVCPNSL